jgi:hypothetical protein
VPPPYQQYPPREPVALLPKPPRPSGWWWALPAALVTAAVAVFAFVLLPIFLAPLHTDVSVPFDGIQHEAVLKSTGQKELWIPRGTLLGFGCVVRDAPTNQTITLTPLSGSLTRTINGQLEFAVYRFSPMSEHILVVCTQPGPNPPVVPDVQIGPRVGTSRFGGTAGALVLVLGLLVAGAIATLVLIILFATRGPRRPLPPA